jgi:hypothetical protein
MEEIENGGNFRENGEEIVISIWKRDQEEEQRKWGLDKVGGRGPEAGREMMQRHEGKWVEGGQGLRRA